MEISSSMDIGEHPGSQLGQVYAFTNCDYIKLYKNGVYVSTGFTETKRLSHTCRIPPVFTDDFIGDALTEKEHSTRPRLNSSSPRWWRFKIRVLDAEEIFS